MSPLIGITCSFSSWDFADSHMKGQAWFYVSWKYIESVREAGGIPLILPFQDVSVVEKIDGLLLSGGVDIDPHRFREMPMGVGYIDPERDEFEISLTQAALKRDIPVLGICRGIQVLCVAFGGTLLQDIGKQYLKHVQDAPCWYGSHFATLSGRLGEIYEKEKISVNSFHHQTVRKIPKGFSDNARSEDGLIEGMSLERGFVVGVQWHPEWMTEKYPIHRKLFSEFVTAAIH
jgi:putative glutamine amidotransferase